MKIKLPQLLLRYIVEGVLIFVSVYGAFLLEDYRSKSEQKEIFRNRWKGLINSISTDSIKFTDMLHFFRKIRRDLLAICGLPFVPGKEPISNVKPCRD